MRSAGIRGFLCILPLSEKPAVRQRPAPTAGSQVIGDHTLKGKALQEKHFKGGLG
jgi:hypothetical protein